MAELDSPEMMAELIRYLSSLLQRLSETNDLNIESHFPADDQRAASVFHGLTRPNISVQSYLERIFKYASCSPSCLVVAYVYLDRFAQRQPLLPINSYNVHRLLITSVMVAAKFMDDLYYNNAYYAKIGGISTTEMNYLEVDFLFGMGFHLNVTPDTFYTFSSLLRREMLLLRPPIPTPRIPFTQYHRRASSTSTSTTTTTTPSSLGYIVGGKSVDDDKFIQYSCTLIDDDTTSSHPHRHRRLAV